MQCCYFHPYPCEFCGHKDTYKVITGFRIKMIPGPSNFGHQLTCPEVPLACPNKFGSVYIKRKDMDSHHSKCSQECSILLLKLGIQVAWYQE